MAEAGSFRSFTASDLDYKSGKYLLRYDVFVVWVSFPFSLLLSPGVFNYSPALVSGKIVSLPAYVIIRL
ncbi:F2E2.10 [Arabidopsis thaliana]|uniref:F2E2.10 n=1 Tax=Arabidopsis thaliana TaxID=3702 RepID=Q9LM56_ARATH|nr:F2E2.10 [Arabidopsis thaliana]